MGCCANCDTIVVPMGSTVVASKTRTRSSVCSRTIGLSLVTVCQTSDGWKRWPFQCGFFLGGRRASRPARTGAHCGRQRSVSRRIDLSASTCFTPFFWDL